MSGTGFPQTKFLMPNGEVSQSWRYFFQNIYQATGGGAPAITAASVTFTPTGSVTVATVQTAIAQLDTLKVPATRTVNGHALSANVTVTASDVGLGSVTNDAQTKAAIVPNTVPSAAQVLVGNAGGTAYAPVSFSGDAALSSAGAVTVSKIGGMSVSLAGNLTTSGAFASTFTMTGVTAVTFPTSGTLATLAGAESFSNKTITGGSIDNTPIGATTQSTGRFTTVRTNGTVVASLPAAGTAGQGARSFVTDATATTFLSVVAGGGANKVPVVSDGTNWLIG